MGDAAIVKLTGCQSDGSQELNIYLPTRVYELSQVAIGQVFLYHQQLLPFLAVLNIELFDRMDAWYPFRNCNLLFQ
jgi:hypothetical protein